MRAFAIPGWSELQSHHPAVPADGVVSSAGPDPSRVLDPSTRKATDTSAGLSNASPAAWGFAVCPRYSDWGPPARVLLKEAVQQHPWKMVQGPLGPPGS
jgi:hypothetical protein